MLQMTHIQKIYRTELLETYALRELTVSVTGGGFIAVTGSGKTTFLNITGLLESFEHGTYMLDGKDVSRMSDGRVSGDEIVHSQEVITQAAQLNGSEPLAACA